jgi:endonuclease G, mitochondrial
MRSRWPLRRLASLLALGVPLSIGATGLVDEDLGDCASMVEAMGAPIVKGSGRAFTLVCREGHVLAYSDDYKTPIWVVERLTRKRFNGAVPRASGWRSGPDLVNSGHEVAVDSDYAAASKKEHRKFDRGHMAPAASMKWDAEAMKESFYLSNAAPQQGHLLNRHIWADLEFMVRDWTCDRGELYVITGPLYEADQPDTIGDDKVAVPSGFYKVAFEPVQKRAIAFILPNQEVDSKGKDTAVVLSGYIKTVGEVERSAGIRLFDDLDARDRSRIQRTKPAMWGVRTGCKLPRK